MHLLSATGSPENEWPPCWQKRPRKWSLTATLLWTCFSIWKLIQISSGQISSYRVRETEKSNLPLVLSIIIIIILAVRHKYHTVPLCTFMEGRSVTLFGNVVLCHYNYWNSGSRLVYVLIDCHFLCKHRKVQKNAYLFWHEHTVCKFLCHATDVFTCSIVTVERFLSNLIAESLKTLFIFQYIHLSSSISR